MLIGYNIQTLMKNWLQKPIWLQQNNELTVWTQIQYQ